jgi:RHS repeat-associated protein
MRHLRTSHSRSLTRYSVESQPNIFLQIIAIIYNELSSTASTRAHAETQNMVTAAKNSTTLKSPHRSALATRNSPTQTHLCRNNSTARWNRARYYHAELGRFISRDPIGYVDGMNLYRAYFVPGLVDPDGLFVQEDAFDEGEIKVAVEKSQHDREKCYQNCKDKYFTDGGWWMANFRSLFR